MLVKIHTANDRKVISIADKDLLGKEFEEGDKYLKISEQFYGGEDLDGRDILKLINDSSSINIVGKESISFAVENKIVERDNVLNVEGVPCAIVIFYGE
jgi:uncharacterized protein